MKFNNVWKFQNAKVDIVRGNTGHYLEFVRLTVFRNRITSNRS